MAILDSVALFQSLFSYVRSFIRRFAIRIMHTNRANDVVTIICIIVNIIVLNPFGQNGCTTRHAANDSSIESDQRSVLLVPYRQLNNDCLDALALTPYSTRRYKTSL